MRLWLPIILLTVLGFGSVYAESDDDFSAYSFNQTAQLMEKYRYRSYSRITVNKIAEASENLDYLQRLELLDMYHFTDQEMIRIDRMNIFPTLGLWSYGYYGWALFTDIVLVSYGYLSVNSFLQGDTDMGIILAIGTGVLYITSIFMGSSLMRQSNMLMAEGLNIFDVPDEIYKKDATETVSLKNTPNLIQLNLLNFHF